MACFVFVAMGTMVLSEGAAATTEAGVTVGASAGVCSMVAVWAEVYLPAAFFRGAQVLPAAGVSVTFMTLVTCSVVVLRGLRPVGLITGGGVASGGHDPYRYLLLGCQDCEGKRGRVRTRDASRLADPRKGRGGVSHIYGLQQITELLACSCSRAKIHPLYWQDSLSPDAKHYLGNYT